MKSTVYRLLGLLLFACPVLAQNGLVPGTPVFKAAGLTPQLLPFVTITFCTSTATGAPCSPLAQAYADSTNGSPINQGINPLKTDALGNFPAFYAAPGQYSYTVTGAGLTTPQGPYQITVSCIPGSTCAALGSNNAFTGNNTHSGTETFTGSVLENVANITQCYVNGSNLITDFGAQINTCIQSLPASPIGGEVDFACSTTGQWQFTTSIVLDRPVHLRGLGIGGQGNRGCALQWNGTGGTMFNLTDATGRESGSILENFAMTNIGTGAVGIDIDNGVYSVKLRDITDSKGTNTWSTAMIRVGNATAGGAIVGTTLDHVICILETTCLLNLRTISTTVTGFSLFNQTNVQVGDATHLAISTNFAPGTTFNDVANGTSLTILNGQGVYVTDTENEIDGTGYAVDCPSTATTCRDIVIKGMRVNTSSFGHTDTYVFDNNLSSASWDISDVVTIGLSAAGFIFRAQTSPQSAKLQGFTTDVAGVQDATSLVNITSFGHNFGGTINATNTWQSNYSCIFPISGTPCSVTLGDGAGRNAIFRSGGSVPNAAVGSTFNGQFDLLQNNSPAVSLIVGGNAKIVNGLNFVNLLASATAPTIAGAGCGGTVAAIQNANGTASFEIFTGTAPTSAGCTVTFPAAAHHWICPTITHTSAVSTTNFIILQTGALSSTSVTFQLFSDVAAATAPTASDTWAVSGCYAN